MQPVQNEEQAFGQVIKDVAPVDRIAETRNASFLVRVDDIIFLGASAWILGIIAALIVIIAFFNYLNIMTTLMRTRAKEMGVWKVLGSSKTKIVGQLVIETFTAVATAGVLSVLILFVTETTELRYIRIHKLTFSFDIVLCVGV